MDLIPAVLVSWAQHSRQTQGLRDWKICPRTSPQVGQVLAQHCQVPGEVGNEVKRKSAGNFGNYGKKSIESYCQVVTSWLNWTEFFEVYMTQIVILNPELYLKSSPIVASIHKNACKMKAYSSLVAMLSWCWIFLSFLAMIGSHPSICHFHCYLITYGSCVSPSPEIAWQTAPQWDGSVSLVLALKFPRMSILQVKLLQYSIASASVATFDVSRSCRMSPGHICAYIYWAWRYMREQATSFVVIFTVMILSRKRIVHLWRESLSHIWLRWLCVGVAGNVEYGMVHQKGYSYANLLLWWWNCNLVMMVSIPFSCIACFAWGNIANKWQLDLSVYNCSTLEGDGFHLNS